MKQIHNSYWSINAILYKLKIKYYYIKNDLLNDLTHSKILWYTIHVCFKYPKINKFSNSDNSKI